jgi:hypothetical protein
MASTRLDAARWALGREIGGSGQFVAEAGSSSATITCTVAFRSSELPTSHLAYAWVFVPSGAAPRQQRVTSTGLDKATGIITLAGQLGSPVATNTLFEIHTKMPAVQEDGSGIYGEGIIPGLHESLNKGLGHALVPEEDYSLPLVNLQYDYDLPSCVDRPERLRAVRQLNGLGNSWVDAATHGHPYEVRESLDGPILHFFVPYRIPSGSHALRLAFLRPGTSKIKVSGLWTESTVGLVNESDEAGLDLAALVALAKPYALAALRDSRTMPAKATYQALYAEAVNDARASRYYDHSNDIDPLVAPRAAPTATPAGGQNGQVG